MATQTLASFDSALKDLYVGPIVEQLNQKTYLLDQIERDADHIDHTGRRAVVPLHKNRNRGRKSIADGGTLPTAGAQVYLDAIVPLRYHTYGIELTDQVIEASKTNEGAFVSAVEAESKGVAVDMRKDINRQAFGLGNGVLAKAETKSKETELLIVNESEMQYIQVGDVIDVLKESNGKTESKGIEGAEVVERVVSTRKLVLSKKLETGGSELGSSTEYAIYISGNRNEEMDGLRNITENERTLHSVNSATAGNAFWKGNTVKAGESVSKTSVAGESLFEQLADNVGAQGNGDVEVFLTTRGVRRRLADSYQSNKRFNDAKAVDVHGGYSAIMVNEVPVIADDDAPKGLAFGFNKSALKWFEQTKPGWLEMENGGIFHLKTAGTGTYAAVWQAWFKWYAALGCVAPNRTGRIEFCSDDAPF
ncbi:MAG TPA: phage major capsid protein [Isosphaeraceae bacterium]|nr:phage major capsid protein [Isosphaeraceae bacterium]